MHATRGIGCHSRGEAEKSVLSVVATVPYVTGGVLKSLACTNRQSSQTRPASVAGSWWGPTFLNAECGLGIAELRIAESRLLLEARNSRLTTSIHSLQHGLPGARAAWLFAAAPSSCRDLSSALGHLRPPLPKRLS